jgi:hypothetical protein
MTPSGARPVLGKRSCGGSVGREGRGRRGGSGADRETLAIGGRRHGPRPAPPARGGLRRRRGRGQQRRKVWRCWGQARRTWTSTAWRGRESGGPSTRRVRNHASDETDSQVRIGASGDDVRRCSWVVLPASVVGGHEVRRQGYTRAGAGTSVVIRRSPPCAPSSRGRARSISAADERSGTRETSSEEP